MVDFNYEKERLKAVISVINKQLEEIDEELLKLKTTKITYDDAKRGEQFNISSKISDKLTTKNKLDRLKDSPYFGKFVFSYDDVSRIGKFYIGKSSLFDGSTALVTDWRAPVASLYYDGHLGKTSYYVDDKEISGEILEKDQIIIEIKATKQLATSAEAQLVNYLSATGIENGIHYMS